MAFCKAKDLSLYTKLVAVIMAFAAGIASFWFHDLPVNNILAACTFIAASHITIDLSMIKTAGQRHEAKKTEGETDEV